MMQDVIARTGYLTSVTAWILFLLADAARPGFVARFFSPHIFLLAAIAFGAWWLWLRAIPNESRWGGWVLALVAGAVGALVAWNVGEGLTEFRLLVVALAFFTPLLIRSLTRLNV